MSAAVVSIRDLIEDQKREVARRAADVLREGGLVVVPTETVYGVAASAGSEGAMGALRRLGGAAVGSGGTWHAESGDRLIEGLEVAHPAHRRAVRRLSPGPVRFLVERGERAGALERSLGAIEGSLASGGVFSARVPDHAFTREVLALAGAPVVAERLGSFGWGGGRELPGALRENDPARTGVALVIDDGPARHGKASSAIRLTPMGGYEVVSEGAMEARTIHRRLDRTVLFVCTGNTCRSPMAEAIARSLAGGRVLGSVKFSSAGTGAASGERPSSEAVSALREMGIESLDRHRARGLTRQLVSEAEVIFAMTPTHVRCVLDIAPDAAGRVFTLDPRGEDIPDPIGLTLDEYRRTAQRLRELIEQRLSDLERQETP